MPVSASFIDVHQLVTRDVPPDPPRPSLLKKVSASRPQRETALRLFRDGQVTNHA